MTRRIRLIAAGVLALLGCEPESETSLFGTPWKAATREPCRHFVDRGYRYQMIDALESEALLWGARA